MLHWCCCYPCPQSSWPSRAVAKVSPRQPLARLYPSLCGAAALSSGAAQPCQGSLVASGRARGTTALGRATGTSFSPRGHRRLQWWVSTMEKYIILICSETPGSTVGSCSSDLHLISHAREIGHLVHLRGRQYQGMGSMSCWPWPTSHQWGHGRFM